METRGVDPVLAPADGTPPAHLDQALFDRLCRAGLTPAQASRLAAHLVGLPVASRTAWTFREIQRLMFLRWLVEHRRLVP
jgi:hypothetical protein